MTGIPVAVPATREEEHAKADAELRPALERFLSTTSCPAYLRTPAERWLEVTKP